MLSLMLKLVFIWLCITCIITEIQAGDKRGINLSGRTYKCGDLEAFSSVTWWYDWTFRAKGFEKAGCTERNLNGYVPMIAKAPVVSRFVAPPNTKYILGFNEPNKADQANLTVAECAALWPTIESKSQGLPLVGPSLAGCGNAQRCIDWYTEFFTACPNCRVDYIGAHAYSCNAQHVVDAMETIAKHFGKNVWLTEFACAAGRTSEEQTTYLTEILPLLEASPYIEKYAWFTNRMRENTTFITDVVNLMDRENPTLSDVGTLYDQHL